ncbi:MAG TPA: type IV pilus assembly protein PilM [Gemmatales bacterium]|nr:type IV pilus assembly protein PilM [Gemmatales bacterium]
MAAKQHGVWGIDLGQSALKALRLELIDGVVTATAFDYIEHPKILSQPDADPDQLTRDALNQFLSRNSLQGDLIAISVPGQTGLARFVKLPPVEAKKIPDIVKFEAKQQIPFPLDEVVWDWQKIGSDKSEDFAENEVGLFAMKRDMVSRYLQSFRDVMIEVHHVQMSPLALVNYVAFDHMGKKAYGTDEPAAEGDAQESGCLVAVDVGVDNSNLVVTDGQKVIWQRPIPIGGNHFTRTLTKELKLTFAKAEHLKRNATKAEDPKKIFQAMKPVFSDFVGELQRSLGFFTNTHRGANITRMVGLGNAFRLPGLQKFVSQSLGMELEKVEEFTRLTGDDVKKAPVFADNILSFAVAYGLALQGLKQSRIQTNLLPNEIRVERLIRAKKPMALIGAAALLLGLGIYSWSSGSGYAHAKAASDETKKTDLVLNNAQTLKTQYETKRNEVIDARKAAANIIRGSEERVNWPIFYRLLNDSLPRPNGSNLPNYPLWDTENPTTKYRTIESQRAYDILLERVQQALLTDNFNQNDLIQLNITGVYARFCDVPMANSFFTSVKKSSNNMYPDGVRTDWPTYRGNDDWKAAPTKPGWVIEIRGYTYHKNAQYFVAHTLVENLKKRKAVAWPLQNPSPVLTPLETSHVALLKYKTTSDPSEGFSFIDAPLYINALVNASNEPGAATGPDGGAGGMRMGETGTAGGPASSASRTGPWVGLGMVHGSAGGSGTTSAPTGAPTGSTERPIDRKRTEFIIVMYWVEPLPTEPDSDKGLPALPATPPGN